MIAYDEYNYQIDEDISILLEQLDREKALLDQERPLNPAVLERMQEYFRIQHIYHSNAIEGNSLTLSETELVVREGLTIGGKSQKEHLEAINYNFAINYLEELARGNEEINERVIKELHQIILRSIDDENAGKYRLKAVRISGSEFIPPEPILVPELMEKFFQWYETDLEHHSIIKSSIAHAKLAEIHPFIDGNGRTARLLMNLILMRTGYPIAIIRKEDRPRYYEALEISHQKRDISPLVELIIERNTYTLREYLRAIREEKRAKEWAKKVADKGIEIVQKKLRNQYDIWRLKMEGFSSEFRHRVELLIEQRREKEAFKKFGFYFNEYEIIDFEKYADLCKGKSRELSWFCKLTFGMTGGRTEKFVLFFGFPSQMARQHLGNQETVSLFISRREITGYKKLEQEPVSFRELFYNHDAGQIEVRIREDGKEQIVSRSPGEYAEQFINEVLENYYSFPRE